MKKIFITLPVAMMAFTSLSAQKFEPIKFGNFDQWLTRNIKESKLLGGATKQVYEIAPTATDNTGNAYTNRGGSPWATSNVLAKPAGIAKTSNAVYPEDRPGHGKAAKLTCQYEHCKVAGMVNMDVIVGGTIFTGEMLEPVKTTSNPYSKMNMGMPFTRRPKALRFDYKVFMPKTNERIYSSGFGKKKTIAGSDKAEAVVVLQRRVEDAKGNITAYRVGTARELFSKSTSGWVNNHSLPITYGQTSIKGLIPESKSYYAKNSKGKMVPVKEIGWDPNGTPTHAVVMFSAAGGEPYVGTLDLTLWVDNVGWVF